MIGNLLTEKLIATDCGKHSLPGLFAAMARGGFCCKDFDVGCFSGEIFAYACEF